MNFPDLMIRSERSRFKSHLLTCLGGEWPEPCPLNPRVVERIQREDHTLEKVEYQVEPGECVTSYVLVPNKPICAPTPAIAVWHQHNGEHQFGKSEPAGLMGSPIHHTGVALVQEGYIVICPDAIAFEERRDSTKKNLDCERFIFQNYLTVLSHRGIGKRSDQAFKPVGLAKGQNRFKNFYILPGDLMK